MAAYIEGTRTRPWAGPLITEEQRAEFDDRGFVLLEGVLARPLVERLTRATDRVWKEQRAGGLDHGGSLHLKGFVTLDAAFLDLLDHPTTFRLVVGHPRMDIFVYHCHLDVNPPRGNGLDRKVGVAPRRRTDRSGPGNASRADDVGEAGLLSDGRLGARPGQPPCDAGPPGRSSRHPRRRRRG